MGPDATGGANRCKWTKWVDDGGCVNVKQGNPHETYGLRYVAVYVPKLPGVGTPGRSPYLHTQVAVG